MKRFYRTLSNLLFLTTGMYVSPLYAQTSVGPDVRGIDPLMMLVVDTSASMEYKTECDCNCADCYPTCDGNTFEKNRWAVTLEVLTGGWTNGFTCQQFTRNDQSVFDYDFGSPVPYHQPWQCPSSTSGICNSPEYRVQDEDGILDTYRTRVRFGLMTFDSEPTYRTAAASTLLESEFNDNLSRSAEGVYSYGPSESILVFDTDGNPIIDAAGNWDYLETSDRYRGPNAEDKYVGHLNFPGCQSPYRIDTGVRRSAETGEQIVGGLISPLDGSDLSNINSAIQESLLGTRPYLGTPIGPALDDLYFYLKGDQEVSGEPLFACRGRYALLITDGEPDEDIRNKTACDCEDATECCMADRGMNSGSCSDDTVLATYDPDARNFQCPYPTPEQAARALLCGYGTSCDAGVIEKLFVVGFSLPDCDTTKNPVECTEGSKGEQIYNRLQDIAAEGSPDGQGTALFADDLSQLRSTLADVLDNIASEPVSRTTPTFASSSQSTGIDLVQYQFSTGFVVGSIERDIPWSGILERKRVESADNPDGYIEHNLDTNDRFHEVLNNRTAPRKLYTVLPKPNTSCADDLDPTSDTCTLNDHLFRGQDTDPCGNINCVHGSTCSCDITSSSECGPDAANCPLSAEQLGANINDNTRRQELIKWLHAIADINDPDYLKRRARQRLGDIYFSSPAVIGKPMFERGDESYNIFRQSATVKNRPMVLYVGTNDGILHAFSVEQFPPSGVSLPDPYSLTSYETGQEIWGIIPPILIKHIDDVADEHREMVDGTPVVKDVFLARRPGLELCTDPDSNPTIADPTGFCNYRTILVTGLRGGGRAYIALDVTNPTDPQFLWQFAHQDLGLTYGRPGIGQVTVKWPVGSADAELMERAVAILPGGVNPDGAGTGFCPSFRHDDAQSSVYQTRNSPDNSSTNLHDHRESVRCWPEVGRSLFIVDIKTGALIKQLDHTIFPSPVVGSPSLFHGEVGSVATRAFVNDVDGVIWRIDLSKTDPEPNLQDQGWTARPFHDLYWSHTSSTGYREGQPSYEQPILSVDYQGRVVVIHGTGDTDDFEDATARNYVVSLTETNVFEQGINVDPDEVQAAFNWEIGQDFTDGGKSYGMKASELVTGPIEVFDQKVFFASFLAVSDASNACAWGKSHLFAVDYLKHDETKQNPGSSPPTYYPLELTATQIGTDAANFNTYHDEKLYMGVGIVKRPQYHTVDTDTDDPYLNLGGLVNTTSTSAPVFEIVSSASGGEKEEDSELGTATSRISPPSSVSHTVSMSTSCE